MEKGECFENSASDLFCWCPLLAVWWVQHLFMLSRKAQGSCKSEVHGTKKGRQSVNVLERIPAGQENTKGDMLYDRASTPCKLEIRWSGTSWWVFACSNVLGYMIYEWNRLSWQRWPKRSWEVVKVLRVTRLTAWSLGKVWNENDVANTLAVRGWIAERLSRKALNSSSVGEGKPDKASW